MLTRLQADIPARDGRLEAVPSAIACFLRLFMPHLSVCRRMTARCHLSRALAARGLKRSTSCGIS